jgi:hypothetical protein
MFKEEQRAKQVWVFVLVYLIAIGIWGSFVTSIMGWVDLEPGPAAILLLVFGIGLPAFLHMARLTVELHPDHVLVIWHPLRTVRLYYRDMAEVRSVTFRPIRDWGGWGVRWVPGKGMAYTMSLSGGVEIKLKSGKLVVVGSQKAEQLEQAIAAQVHGRF